MAYQYPSVADFQNQFLRDFPYGVDKNTSVLDSDIANAFVQANMNINQGLFPDQGTFTFCYNLLAAHYLVLSIRSSSQGINGQYNWIQNNKSVGGVSEGFQVPDRIAANPFFTMLTKTNYGARYLELLLPALTGKMMALPMPAHAL